MLSNNGKKTCDECTYYIGCQLVCPNCRKSNSRTNRERHYRSYRCRVILPLKQTNLSKID